MRFSCGETPETQKARLSEWHPFFALWPRIIKVEGGREICAWLEWIERRGFYHDEPYSTTLFGWEYREKQ